MKKQSRGKHRRKQPSRSPRRPTPESSPKAIDGLSARAQRKENEPAVSIAESSVPPPQLEPFAIRQAGLANEEQNRVVQIIRDLQQLQPLFTDQIRERQEKYQSAFLLMMEALTDLVGTARSRTLLWPEGKSC